MIQISSTGSSRSKLDRINRVLGIAVLLLSTLVFDCQFLHAWQAGDGRPQEYIESSSPLPGGGVVSSVYYPGQSTPVVSSSPESGQGNSVLVRDNPPGDTSQPRVAQSSSGYVYPPANYANPPAVNNNPPAVSNYPGQGFYAVPAAQQVPNLGVPVPWNRALRPVCAGCGPGQSAYGSPVYGPAGLTGLQPPAATLPPVLTNPATNPPQVNPQYATPPQQPVYQPLVQLQNMPPNAYPGQGIFGSPKLYVDGQPVRNFMRYLIIP